VSFHEVLLPLPFALGASGGPERRVDIVALGSGREARNTPWAHGRRRYDIGGAVRTLDELHALIAFFEARRGRLYGFRFRDFLDWKSCAPSASISPNDQMIGVADGVQAAFQLTKAYGGGETAYLRPIRKPAAGSLRVALDEGEAAPEDFTLDAATGMVTFSAPPASGAVVSAGFHFDTPVRFDSERLELAIDSFSAGRAVSVPLIEILI
jgi:uncharacterized protein (TIGR02217 family)